MRAPLDSPTMEGFRNQIERVNPLAEQSPGFVRRLTTDEMDATATRVFADPLGGGPRPYALTLPHMKVRSTE